ncbi:MAG: hypothetical protein F4Y26_08910 [Gammaproteobacteria bacterium]|nr:hypothetical protein [Gammaproteobacteria bacterium]
MNVSNRHLARAKRRGRVLTLLDAAERAGVAPLPSARLHALAYLADVLSPVWDLIPFDGKVYKSDGSPHYPDLQQEMDALVVLGLVEASGLSYEVRARGGARVDGLYGLNFTSPHLEPLLCALGARGVDNAIDPEDVRLHDYLVELAGALATLPNDEIESATGFDVTYRTGAPSHNVVDFAEWVDDKKEANPSWQAADRFEEFFPAESNVGSGEKLYLYAAYLGRAMNGR